MTPDFLGRFAQLVTIESEWPGGPPVTIANLIRESVRSGLLTSVFGAARVGSDNALRGEVLILTDDGRRACGLPPLNVPEVKQRELF